MCNTEKIIINMIVLSFFTTLCLVAQYWLKLHLPKLRVKHGAFCITGSCPIWLHLMKFTLELYRTGSNYLRAICSSLSRFLEGG